MLVEEVSKAFKERGLTLGSAESFTGGLFARTITAISGASKFYKGGYVTYATEEKINLIQVPVEIINRFGVISREVAYYMANNSRQLLHTDYCVSFTGNAGPEAMEGKPVGEVHMCIASAQNAQVYSLKLEGTRQEIQDQAVEYILKNLLYIITKNA